MGWLALTEMDSFDANTVYVLASGGSKTHVVLHTGNITLIEDTEGGPDCVLHTTDSREFQVRNNLQDILTAIAASAVFG